MRKNIRLKNYDYSQDGLYYITICVKGRHEILGTVTVGAIINRPQIANHTQIVNRPQPDIRVPRVELSECGRIADQAINGIEKHYPYVSVDKYIIMPDHLHMILALRNNGGGGRLIIAPTSVSFVVQQLKRCVSKQVGSSIWQKSFHEHVIRSEPEYQEIWKYIDENPRRWADGRYGC